MKETAQRPNIAKTYPGGLFVVYLCNARQRLVGITMETFVNKGLSQPAQDPAIINVKERLAS